MRTLKNLFLVCGRLIVLILPAVASAGAHGAGRSAAFWVAPNIRANAERIADLERKVADAKGSADNAWMPPCSYWFFVLRRAILAGAILGK